MTYLASEEALRIMVVIGLVICVVGLLACGAITIPLAVRDIRRSQNDSTRRTVFKWDLYNALMGLTGLAVMLVILLLLLFAADTPTRAAVVRVGILILLSALTGVCIIAPLRTWMIERAAKKAAERHRRN